MRLFIAIELPEEIRRSLVRVQNSLRPVVAAKWVRVEQLHLTLKFLGETPDAELPGLIEELNRVRFDAFELSTAGVVCFPPHGPIRIVAARLEDAERKCASLQREIDKACHAAGFRLEGREWIPHVTLARVKMRLPSSARAAAIGTLVERESFLVDYFSLMESRLDQPGPEYVAVARFEAKTG